MGELAKNACIFGKVSSAPRSRTPTSLTSGPRLRCTLVCDGVTDRSCARLTSQEHATGLCPILEQCEAEKREPTGNELLVERTTRDTQHAMQHATRRASCRLPGT
jgi:hypothetical protein